MNPQNPIRVRFAPSPTGNLHIGGARTALFNYLFARYHKGSFLLRIEDTDRVRSLPAHEEQIFRSLKWLGFFWDEAVVNQSNRLEMYRSVCRILMQSGQAYPCFCTKEMLQKKREMAESATGGYKYDGSCRQLDPEEAEKKILTGISYSIRFRVPEGNIEFNDLIHGKTVFRSDELDDFIIQRTDGTPVYQIAVVTDDHAMNITHVIRGDDHLSNTPKQVLLYKAAQWNVPVFAHLPMIWGPDKKRLSKRHGAVSVDEFESKGILPEALVNYLALLGWAPGNDQEIFSFDELIKSFNLSKVSKKPAVFDEQKLMWMNGVYLRNRSVDDLISMFLPQIETRYPSFDRSSDLSKKYLRQVIVLMKERIRTTNDLFEQGGYFFTDPDQYEEKAVSKYWADEGGIKTILAILKLLRSLESWNQEILEKEIRNHAAENNMGAGQLIHPIRLALTGKTKSPGLFELMVLLGREVVYRRLEKAMVFLNKDLL